jgi:hypothetical protein
MVMGIFGHREGGEEKFGDRGDAGSVVWDKQGRALGLLGTEQTPQQCHYGYSLVTPIEDVFESIKAASEGVILDVQIAEP